MTLKKMKKQTSLGLKNKQALRAFVREKDLTYQQFAATYDVCPKAIQSMIRGMIRKATKESAIKIMGIIYNFPHHLIGYGQFPVEYWATVDLLNADDRDLSKDITLCRPCIKKPVNSKLCEFCSKRTATHRRRLNKEKAALAAAKARL